MLKYFERIQSKKCNSVVYEIEIPNINLHISRTSLALCPYGQKKTSGKDIVSQRSFFGYKFYVA